MENQNNFQAGWDLNQKNKILGHMCAELAGSEKQVSWARQIREDHVKNLNDLIRIFNSKNWADSLENENGRLLMASFFEAYQDLKNQDSKFWIEKIRGKSFESRVREISEKLKKEVA